MGFEIARRSAYGAARNSAELQREISRVRTPALLANTRIHAASLVARSALINVELLTDLEAEVCKRHGALIDVRAHAIVDTFTGLCVNELSKLTLEQ